MLDVLDAAGPFLADLSRVGAVIAAMAFALRIVRSAYNDATDRYKITAEEASTNLASLRNESKERQREMNDTIKALEKRLDDMAEQLARCRHESLEATLRETRLAARIQELERHVAQMAEDQAKR